MSVSTISSSIVTFVTLGSGNYADILTITNTGTIGSGTFHEGTGVNQSFQVTLGSPANRLFNAGVIEGGTAHTNTNYNPYLYGLTGVVLGAGYIYNSGLIAGGYGVGVAVGVAQSGGTLVNSGTIIGGRYNPGNAGYVQLLGGVNLVNGILINNGTILGGTGETGLVMSGGTAVNHGYIVGEGGLYRAGNGVVLSGGYLLNAGTISGGASRYEGLLSAVRMSGGTLNNTGVLFGGVRSGALNLYESGTVENAGTIDGVRFVGSTIAATVALENSGLITLGATANGMLNVELSDSGTILGGIRFGLGDSGLTLAPGAVIKGSVSAVPEFTIVTYGTGTISFPTITTFTNLNEIDLASAATKGSIDLGGSFSGFNMIDFGPSAAWVLGGTAAELAAGQSISGFELGDTLVVDGFTTSGHSFSGGALTLNNASQSLTIDLSGSFSGLIVTDVAKGTEIAVCYLRGTPILTPQGERAIEELRSGDAVVTKFGGARPVKWIGVQTYAGRFLHGNPEMLPVCIKANALAPGQPVRDLFVSPGHSLLLEGQLILAKYLVNGITVTQDEPPARVDYFNIELEAHDCLMAAGVWAESYAECAVTRGMFHNAADFAARFPAHVAPEAPLLCAPRPLSGAALAEAIAPVVARAATLASPGPLRGYVDVLTQDGRIEGWAQDETNPELPVWLDILRDGVIVTQVLACGTRPDLRAAGLGSGRHAFKLKIADGTGRVEVRRAGAATKLPLTEAARAA